MSNGIRGIIMDFGDTLVSYPLHTAVGQLRFIEEFVSDFLIEHLEFPRPARPLGEFALELNRERPDGSTYRLTERLADQRLFGPQLTTDQARLFEVSILDAVFLQARLCDDAHRFVRGCKALGLKTGLMSNLPWGTDRNLWDIEFQRHGFDATMIDTVVCCMDSGFRKPHPAAIESIVAQWSLPSTSVAFVGDNQRSDMAAAKAAGCLGIFVDRLGEGAAADVDYVCVSNLDEALAWVEREATHA